MSIRLCDGVGTSSVRQVLAIAGDSDCMMDLRATKSNSWRGGWGRRSRRGSSRMAGEAFVRGTYSAQCSRRWKKTTLRDLPNIREAHRRRLPSVTVWAQVKGRRGGGESSVVFVVPWIQASVSVYASFVSQCTSRCAGHNRNYYVQYLVHLMSFE